MKLFRDLTGDDDSTADGHDEAADERECHLPVRHVVDFLEEEEARCGEHLHARQVISGNQQTWKKRTPIHVQMPRRHTAKASTSRT